ncbi:MAG: hypothetical protein QNJ54_24855 [Prochloraceae cyanobacterium]|nr:hypothetical protein [Prochloraceae cyanobacterium]
MGLTRKGQNSCCYIALKKTRWLIPQDKGDRSQVKSKLLFGDRK